MAKSKIKIAVVGCGSWGKNLVRTFFNLHVLDTVCDSDKAKLQTVSQEYSGIKTTEIFADILKNKDISAVVIATPAQSHYHLALQALMAGKDVFIEKPLALKLEEGGELVRLAKYNGKIIIVGHVLEYHPAIKKLKELIDKGELGTLQYIYSNRLNLGKFRKEENILWSFAPHDISVMLLLLGEMPQDVSSFGGNYLHRHIADVTLSNLSFASGVKGHIFVSWLHPYKEQKLIVVGEKKMAVFDDTLRQNKLLLFPHKISWVNGFPVPKKENAQMPTYENTEPLLLECRHFLDCLKTRSKPKTDGVSALKVLEVLDACQKSLENKGALVKFKNKRNYFVHHSSLVEYPATIGKETKIWDYSHVMKGAKIGKNCVVGQNCFIASKAVVGDNVKIQNNVSVYEAVTLEDNVFCAPSVVFTNVLNPRSFIKRKTEEYKKTLIKEGATLGANATIVCGNTIGKYAFVGAGSVVTKDVPDYALVCGNPARVKGWVCICGIKMNVTRNKATCGCCQIKYAFSKGVLKQINKV